jgi:ribosomal protein S18 acetylase RimI-like enzyme
VFAPAGRGGPLAFLARAFADGAGEFGWRNHVVATMGDEVVGVGAAYSGRTALPFMLAAARQILGHAGPVAGPGVIWRGLRTERVIPPPVARNLLYLGHLGIDPRYRGQGIGAALVAHLVEGAADRGFTRAGLDVSVANPRAQALYERLGFRVTAEQASRLANAHATVPPHRRMERPLQAASVTMAEGRTRA